MENNNETFSDQKPTTTTDGSQTKNTTAGDRGGSKRMFIAIIVVGVIIALGYYFIYANGKFPQLGKDGANEDQIVAIVNGEEIDQAAYDQSIQSLTNTALQGGADVENPEIQALIEEQALASLINNQLLLQEAAKQGIVADEEEVQSQFDAIETNVGGPELLAARMEELGVNEENLKRDIREQLIINNYLEAVIDVGSVSVTDEEIQAYLDEANPEGAELPPYEEIKPQIESMLLSQKQLELVQEFLETLKESADIETFI